MSIVTPCPQAASLVSSTLLSQKLSLRSFNTDPLRLFALQALNAEVVVTFEGTTEMGEGI